MGLRALWLAAEGRGRAVCDQAGGRRDCDSGAVETGAFGVRTVLLAVIALLAVGLSLLGVSPVLVLVFAGLLSMASLATKNRFAGRGWIAESSRASESCCRSNGGCSRGRGFSGWDLAAVLVVF